MTRELLFSVTMEDCDLETFRAGGPGGQHQNKTESGVRIRHRASGAVGESRDGRSQYQNKKKAFARMADHPRFKLWLAEVRKQLDTGKTAEERVDEMMQDQYLRLEVKENGKWKVVRGI